ncbi:hypothetical protein HOS78_gp096 [Lactobacillus phage Bacchae]|uniref:Uncharacterized protein n=1 Tax=Lactobacillus phage Bacchae TaxID=2079429 RepID=A0A2K9VCT9_9CAUD|nr:hypothetical protein HOS78_gp096 [Lactobacillus phage Bacchae]AUV60032.1 hypothetical protein [Lactobacillus phage Bacchae]
MEQLDLFSTTDTTSTTENIHKRKRKVKSTTKTTQNIYQNIVEEESRLKELLPNPKPFDSLRGAISWFTTKQYTWYCNTVERPERALRGLQSHLSVSDDKFAKLLANDKVMVGVAKGTYLIYFKK